MSESEPAPIGSIGWMDLTVDNADQVRDFYAAVVGWKVDECAMGDYNDYTMCEPESGAPRTGVCHARGGNAQNPAKWIMYIVVADLDASMASCTELGGKIVVPARNMGKARYCVIEDPAGAVSALYQS